jgi:hypothetical protein
MQNYLKQNTAALAQKYPGLNWPLLLQQYNRQPDSRTAAAPARNGQPTALLNGLAVHSTYNPTAEAEKLLTQQPNTDTAGGFVLLGYGLGYLAEALILRYPDRKLYLAEDDFSLLFYFLSLRDLRNVIENPNVFFLFGHETPEQLATLWQLHKLFLLQTFTNRALYQCHTAFFDKVYQAVKNFNMRKQVNANTLKRYARLWLRNLARNAGALAEALPVSAMFGRFAGMPAVVIGAGVSLETLLPVLPQIRQHAILVCVDTAYRILLHHGIEADFLIITDSQYWNSRHLDNCRSTSTLFIGELGIYPSLLHDSTAFKRFFCNSFFPVARLFESMVEEKGSLKSGGSVATTAFDLCRQLGASGVWLIGIDLAFPKGKTHARGSRFEEWALSDHTRLKPLYNTLYQMSHTAHPFYTKAQRGGHILTDERMLVYKKWFEEEALSIKTFNLSAGVKIEGAITAAADDLLALPVQRPVINEIIMSLHAQAKTDTGALRSRIKKAVEEFIKSFALLADYAAKFIAALTTHDAEQTALLHSRLPALKENELFTYLFDEELSRLSALTVAGPSHHSETLTLLTVLKKRTVMYKNFFEESLCKK